MTKEVGAPLLTDYAENFCEKNFDKFDVYDSSDPYYTLKDLGRRRIVVDVCQDTFMDETREACMDNRSDFFGEKLVPAVIKMIGGYRSDRSTLV